MSLPLRTLIALPLTLLACASTPVPNECRGRCLDGGQIGADGGPNGAYPDLPEGPKPDVLPPTGEWPPVREGAQTCTLPAAPEVSEMEVEEVFPALDFTRPLFFGYANDGSQRRYVAEQGGRVWVFEGRPDVEGAQLFFEVPVSRSNNEEGLLGLAFHPAYAQNGKAYVYYSTPPENGERQTVLAEYRRAADGLTLDPATARLLLTVPQPYGNHKGGALLFGPDGFLYLGLGDGGAGGDPHNNGQNTQTLLGKVLRIDVDTSDATCLTPYGIPEDNPFALGRCGGGQAGGRPEIFAIGLRNPWRMSFDRESGRLWAGDVGQDEWEEISIIERGKNYGWRRVEGPECYDPESCDLEGFEPPVYSYNHQQGRSITGGYVYRGSAFPELWGSYVYADYNNGHVWALKVGPQGETDNRLLITTGMKITSLGEDPDGELYLVTFQSGTSLGRLKRRDQAPLPSPFPRTLSQTGCFADTASHTVGRQVVRFDVRHPFYSDGASKDRYLALPAGLAAGVDARGRFVLPEGSVLLKTFSYQPAGGAGLRRLETRLLVQRASGVEGYTYVWNEEQTDALLLTGGLNRELQTARGPQVWQFPSRTACLECHTQVAGGTLGTRIDQFNLDVSFGGRPQSQLEALRSSGYLTFEGAADALPKLPAPDDETAAVEARARAVLDVNCAMCHQPDGPAETQIDLRASTSLRDMKVCDVEPGQGELNVANARIVAPGEPQRSVLVERMNRRGRFQMPPLGTNVVDARGTALVGTWIADLRSCD